MQARGKLGTEYHVDVGHDAEQRTRWNDVVRIKKEADKKDTAEPTGKGASSRERKLSEGGGRGRGRVEEDAEEVVWRWRRKGRCEGGRQRETIETKEITYGLKNADS